MCGIFAIGLYYRAMLSTIHRRGGEEPERPTMTTTWRHGNLGQATGCYSRAPGLCNATSDGADEDGYAALRVYRHFANVKGLT